MSGFTISSIINKKIDFTVTDKKGRYAFLVGPSDYYITSQKQDYNNKTETDINLKGSEKERMLVEKDVEMEKAVTSDINFIDSVGKN